MTNAIPHRTLPVGGHHAPRATAQKAAADFQKWFAETLTPAAMPSGTPASVLAGLTATSTATVTQVPGSPASVSTPVDTAASTIPTEPAAVSTPPESVQTGPRISFFEKSVTGVSLEGTPSTYNTLQFATAAAANQIAKLLGGKVVDVELTGAFSRSAPERMIAVGGHKLNAGLVADLFSKYGDAPGSEAWQVINRDLGKTHG
ncbi:MAG: hypothetical protein JWO48_374 [Bryobacterales bacterium]|nr:hypothetical protein [Bryobacterales bacterium]